MSQGVLIETSTRIKLHSESDFMGVYVARVKSQWFQIMVAITQTMADIHLAKLAQVKKK